MRRPLYLDGGGSGPLTVRADGPALRIVREGRPDGRTPLRLLSRVVVRGRVVWQTEALVACMDADVPVAFVTSDGTTRGWCLGAGRREDDINGLIEECVARRDWIARQEDWTRAMERRAILRRLPSGRPVPASLRSEEVRAAEESRLDGLRAPVETDRILRTLTGALTAHVAELLRGEGVAARFAQGQSAPIYLITDFSRILSWDLWPVAERSAAYFVQHPVQGRHDRQIRRRLVRQYEAAAPHVAKAFREVFWRFRLHLKDIAS